MTESVLIRKCHMNCPICDKTHDVEERERLTAVKIKGEEVAYKERFFYCANAEDDENEFETGEMLNGNLLSARNAYRIKKGLLTSEEIVALRENYGLSQVDLSKLLGWGEATISRYESKAIQDEAYDIMLRLIKDNPLQALELLKKNEEKFSPMKRREIRNNIEEKLDSYGKEYLSRQSLESQYVRFEEPSDYNGYVTLNINKIESAVSYFAQRVKNLFKVKLMKMLWYADALSYKTHGAAITGLVYVHDEMGALPIGHYHLMNLENLNVREESSANYELMQHIYPHAGIDCSALSEDDKSILDRVINQFKNFNTKAIVNYMHKEKAYINTGQGDIIPFSLAKEIKEF